MVKFLSTKFPAQLFGANPPTLLPTYWTLHEQEISEYLIKSQRFSAFVTAARVTVIYVWSVVGI